MASIPEHMAGIYSFLVSQYVVYIVEALRITMRHSMPCARVQNSIVVDSCGSCKESGQ